MNFDLSTDHLDRDLVLRFMAGNYPDGSVHEVARDRAILAACGLILCAHDAIHSPATAQGQ